jgi:hypothetical protein
VVSYRHAERSPLEFHLPTAAQMLKPFSRLDLRIRFVRLFRHADTEEPSTAIRRGLAGRRRRRARWRRTALRGVRTASRGGPARPRRRPLDCGRRRLARSPRPAGAWSVAIRDGRGPAVARPGAARGVSQGARSGPTGRHQRLVSVLPPQPRPSVASEAKVGDGQVPVRRSRCPARPLRSPAASGRMARAAERLETSAPQGG